MAIVVIAAGAALAFRRPKAELIAPDTTHTVDRGDMRITVVESGTLQAANSFDVYSELEGQNTIVEIAAEGAYVKEGDLLVELDTFPAHRQGQPAGDRLREGQGCARASRASISWGSA
ncbi:MAG: hypothetical protein U1E76_02265 [Planctomycetota bacterium]